MPAEIRKTPPVFLYLIAGFFTYLGAQTVPGLVMSIVQFFTFLIEKPSKSWPFVVLGYLLVTPIYFGLTYYLFATGFRLVTLNKRGWKDARTWLIFFTICLLLLTVAVFNLPNRTYSDWITILGQRIPLEVKSHYYVLIASLLSLVLGQYFILTRPHIKNLFDPDPDELFLSLGQARPQ